MSKALRNVNVHKTDQREQAKAEQVKNNAGGFVFKVSDLDRLNRFLILGVDGGTYYVSQSDLTKQNVDFLRNLLQKNPELVIEATVDVSVNARAKSNSPAIFTLALAMNVVEDKFKPAVRAAVQKVCRTSTHIFEFAEYVKNLGGLGRAKRDTIAEWYTSKTPVNLGYQMIKYRQRNGWTHGDMLRISHPKFGPGYEGLVNWTLGKEWYAGNTPSIIHAFEKAQSATNINQIVDLVKEYNLPWEAVPTQFHKEPKLWRALFESDSLGQTALLRNVTRLAKLEMFNDMKFAAEYANRLADQERIIKGKMHPVQYLSASVTYSNGQLTRDGGWYGGRSKSWDTNGKISDALDAGYYASFKAVEPANKRTFIAVDVSGSMSCPALGIDLSCAQVAGAMAMTIARTEPYSEIRGFTIGSTAGRWRRESELTDLGITPQTKLASAMDKVQKSNFGGTDCSLPITYALEKGIEIDTFVVITDNDTWAGKIHPFQALKKYRKETGIDARMAVLGTAATDFTIADPSDRGMLDVVGFDSNAPKILTEFSAGRI